MRQHVLTPAKVAVAAALVAGGALASALPVGAAVADDSPPTTLEVHSTAVRKALGAAVEVTFGFTCGGGTSATLDVRFTRRIGSTTTMVQRYGWPTCTGGEQRITVGLHATDRPFLAKSAYVQATLTPHDSTGDVSGASPSAPVLEIEQPVPRKARGAAVEVKFAFTCAAGRYYTLNVFLNQRVGPDIATGSQTRSDRCTGEEQRATLGVTAQEHPFRARSAYYRASIVLSPDYLRADLEGELEVVNG